MEVPPPSSPPARRTASAFPEARGSSIPPAISQPPPSFPVALPHGVRKIIAIAGGRPGVGHSILATNIATYLAQLGRKVVLVDADPSGATLHAFLDVERPPEPRESELGDEEQLLLVPTPIPGLSLLPQRYSTTSTAPVRPGRKTRWAKGLRSLDADYLILDLGPGTQPATLDLYLSADAGVCVTAPDPPSIESTYRFFRALFVRKLQKLLLQDRFKLRLVERAMGELEPLPSPRDLIAAIARYDTASATLAAQELALLRPQLVVNHTRLRKDVELGSAVVGMAHRYLGIRAEELGHIEHDDAVWLSVVRKRPLLVDNPGTKSGRNIERIVRRLVTVLATRDDRTPHPRFVQTEEERSYYDVLGTHRGASDEELRRAYKRQRDLYQAGSLPLCSLVTESELTRESLRIEEAQETLLDPLRRRAYDLSFFPSDGDGEPESSPELDEARREAQRKLAEELSPELHSETDFTGDLLRRVRESQGVQLSEIAGRTKISQSHLESIENEDFDRLPAEVYTRGFVQQLANFLGLDATQASRTYLRRFRAARRSTP